MRKMHTVMIPHDVWVDLSRSGENPATLIRGYAARGAERIKHGIEEEGNGDCHPYPAVEEECFHEPEDEGEALEESGISIRLRPDCDPNIKSFLEDCERRGWRLDLAKFADRPYLTKFRPFKIGEGFSGWYCEVESFLYPDAETTMYKSGYLLPFTHKNGKDTWHHFGKKYGRLALEAYGLA